MRHHQVESRRLIEVRRRLATVQCNRAPVNGKLAGVPRTLSTAFANVILERRDLFTERPHLATDHDSSSGDRRQCVPDSQQSVGRASVV
jgi:hypothetical protein